MRVIPKAASSWTCERYEQRTRKSREDGAKYRANAMVRMQDPPDEEGNVAESWPVSAFSTESVLQRWGDGRYFVRFFDKRGEKVGGWSFSVQAPQPGRTRGGDADDEDRGMPSQKLPTTQLEWLMYQQQRDEQNERRRREELRDERERMREENNERREQDREFLKAVMGHGGAQKGGASDEAVNLAVERMQLNTERQMLAFERRMRTMLDEMDPGDEPDEPDGPPPKNFNQAMSRVGMRLISELEKKAPDLFEQGMPKILDMLRSGGFQPSAELEQELAGVAERRSRVAPNGAARSRG